MEKVSVIVPAYNCEEFIERCLDSIVNQTYKNVEIIVCNDGSSDNTQKILNRYQEKYSNIIVINKENGGVSSARNVAMEYISGKYVSFVDSDDYIEKTMYEKLVEKMEKNNLDMCAVNVNCIYKNKNVIIKSNIDDNQDNHKLLIDAYLVVWNKLYKSELIKGLRMKEGYVYEDVLFLYELYPYIKRMGSIDEALYNYPQNDNSITYTYNDGLYNLVENMDDIINYYKAYGLFDLYKDELEYSYIRYLYATFIKRMAKTKDFNKFNKAVDIVIKKANINFPNYKKNKYIKLFNSKCLYLRVFNKTISKVIYCIEKNKMN